MNVFQSFLVLLTNIIIARKMSVEGYGTYALIIMVLGLGLTLGFSWSSSAILFYGGKEKAKNGNIRKTFWSRNLIIGIMVVLVLLLFVIFDNLINKYIGYEVGYGIFAWLIFRVISDYLIKYFLTIKKQNFSVFISLTIKLAFLLLVIFSSLSIKNIIYFGIISESLSLLFIFKVDKNDLKNAILNKKYFKDILNFSLWQFFGFSGLYIINFGDNAVIKHFMSVKEVGIYNAGYKLFAGLARMSFIITNFYTSEIMEYIEFENNAKLKNFFFKKRFLILILVLIPHIILIIFAKPLILNIFGINYKLAVSIFKILVVGSFIKYCGTFYIFYLNGMKKHKYLQYINVLRAFLNIVLDIIFIQFLGIYGPALGTTIAILISFIILYAVSEGKIKRLCYSQID